LGLIEQGKIDPHSIVAILGKTEGNGGVNDFTREFAVSALSAALAPSSIYSQPAWSSVLHS
jgi:cyanuric acid amidohydrolase